VENSCPPRSQLVDEVVIGLSAVAAAGDAVLAFRGVGPPVINYPHPDP
jgi:hypothetical protein